MVGAVSGDKRKGKIMTKKQTINFHTTREQTYYDPWEHRETKVRFAGRCVICNRTTYQPIGAGGLPFDPDPRGIFTEHHASASFEASEYGMEGPEVPCCFDCHNTHESYEKALAIARGQWKEIQPA